MPFGKFRLIHIIINAYYLSRKKWLQYALRQYQAALYSAQCLNRLQQLNPESIYVLQKISICLNYMKQLGIGISHI